MLKYRTGHIERQQGKTGNTDHCSKPYTSKHGHFSSDWCHIEVRCNWPKLTEFLMIIYISQTTIYKFQECIDLHIDMCLVQTNNYMIWCLLLCSIFRFECQNFWECLSHNRRKMLLLFLCILATPTQRVISCSVKPSNKVVVVGEVVFLICSADEESSVFSWRLGSNGNKGTTVYQDAVYRSDGTLRNPEYIAEGYYVINLWQTRIVLQMNETSLSQGGVYHCECLSPSSTASANVVVLAQWPAFVQVADVAEGRPVNLTCSISFNGTADASFDMSIKSSSGSILNRQSNLLLSANLNRQQMIYSVIADPNVDQTFICSVKLIGPTPSANVLYSRERVVTVQWKPVSSVIILVNQQACHDGLCPLGEQMQCKTDANPKPYFQWWKFSQNSSWSESIIGSDEEYLILDDTGTFVYQCAARNIIYGVTHVAFSDNFTVEVREQMPMTESCSANANGIITGLCVIFALGFFSAVGLNIVLYRKLQKSRFKPKERVEYTTVNAQGLDQQSTYMQLNKDMSAEELQKQTYANIRLPSSDTDMSGGDYMEVVL